MVVIHNVVMDDEDDDLEALRLAALQTIKPRQLPKKISHHRHTGKVPFVRPSTTNPNLIAIVPTEAPPVSIESTKTAPPAGLPKAKPEESQPIIETSTTVKTPNPEVKEVKRITSVSTSVKDEKPVKVKNFDESFELDEDVLDFETESLHDSAEEDLLQLHDSDSESLEKLMEDMEELSAPTQAKTHPLKQPQPSENVNLSNKSKSPPKNKLTNKTKILGNQPNKQRSPPRVDIVKVESPKPSSGYDKHSPVRRRYSPPRQISRPISPSYRPQSPFYSPPSPTYRPGSPSLSKRSFSPRRRSRSPRKRSLSPRKRSLSPRRRSRSPRKRSLSPRRRSPTPLRKRSLTPLRKRSLTPRKRSITPRRRSSSPGRLSMVPRKRSITPRKRSLTPRKRSLTPRRRSLSPRRRSPSSGRMTVAPRKRSITPRKRSLTPRKRSLTPRKRSISPRRRSPSPLRSSVTPRKRSLSPRRRSPSPRRRPLMRKRRSVSPRRRSVSPWRSPGWRSPSPGARSPSPLRSSPYYSLDKRKQPLSPTSKRPRQRPLPRAKQIPSNSSNRQAVSSSVKGGSRGVRDVSEKKEEERKAGTLSRDSRRQKREVTMDTAEEDETNGVQPRPLDPKLEARKRKFGHNSQIVEFVNKKICLKSEQKDINTDHFVTGTMALDLQQTDNCRAGKPTSDTNRPEKLRFGTSRSERSHLDSSRAEKTRLDSSRPEKVRLGRNRSEKLSQDTRAEKLVIDDDWDDKSLGLDSGMVEVPQPSLVNSSIKLRENSLSRSPPPALSLDSKTNFRSRPSKRKRIILTEGEVEGEGGRDFSRLTDNQALKNSTNLWRRGVNEEEEEEEAGAEEEQEVIKVEEETVVVEEKRKRKSGKEKRGDLRVELSRRRAERQKGAAVDPMARIVQYALEDAVGKKSKPLRTTSSPPPERRPYTGSSEKKSRPKGRRVFSVSKTSKTEGGKTSEDEDKGLSAHFRNKSPPPRTSGRSILRRNQV